MTAEQLRAMMAYIRDRVNLVPGEPGSPVQITFDPPTQQDMIGAGLHADGVRQLLHAPWWDEMVTDIIETPDFCEPADPPQQVLEYARDVISDTIRKRFPLTDRQR